MAYLFCYTREGPDKLRDLRDSLHLALSRDGKEYMPLRNNTGVLFPKADMDCGTMPGCTKTLICPWLFRLGEGDMGLLAVRKNNFNKPDQKSIGKVMVYKSGDLINYSFYGFLTLGGGEIKNPRCKKEDSGLYRIEWENEEGIFCAKTAEFTSINCREKTAYTIPGFPPPAGIEGAVPGNIVEISGIEADNLEKYLGTVYNTSVVVPAIALKAGDNPESIENLPKARLYYNDGSFHDMKVEWDAETFGKIDASKKGEYKIPGKIIQKLYPWPFIEHASDPCVFFYNGKYFFTSSNQKVTLRMADTLDGLREALPIIIHEEPETAFWAQEIHYIRGKYYIFTSRCKGSWMHVQSVIFRCKGDPAKPEDWEEARYVVKKDGSLLNKDRGICLDMTYFEIDGTHYVSWSNRDIDRNGDGTNEYGSNGPADIYIATIDPENPWQLTSAPVCLCRPVYGWDRIETEVDEGPFLLRHGEDLFITFSGASVGVVYAVGLLRAKYGSDLLDPSSWEELPYPILTSESFPGQYGPGHNNFFKDPDNPGDDMIALLYRPKPGWDPRTPKNHEDNPRHAALRRVHWNASGLPNLEMTPEQELNPAFKNVSLLIKII
jgi:GH43 family beta-xylosidase